MIIPDKDILFGRAYIKAFKSILDWDEKSQQPMLNTIKKLLKYNLDFYIVYSDVYDELYYLMENIEEPSDIKTFIGAGKHLFWRMRTEDEQEEYEKLLAEEKEGERQQRGDYERSLL